MNLRPLNNRIIVKPHTVKSTSSIVLPDSVEKSLMPTEFEVVASSVTDRVAVGDIIISTGLSGSPIEFEGVRYRMLHIDDVLAVKES